MSGAEDVMPSSSSASVKSKEHIRPSSDQLYNYHNPQSPNLFTSSVVIMSEARWNGNRDGGWWTPQSEREAQQKRDLVCPRRRLLSDAQLCLVSKRQRMADAAVKPQRPTCTDILMRCANGKGSEAIHHVFHCVCQKAAMDFLFSISLYILFILYVPFIKAMEPDLLQRRWELHLLLTSLYAGWFGSTEQKIVPFARATLWLQSLSSWLAD